MLPHTAMGIAMKYYAGIGSRVVTDMKIIPLIHRIARAMDKHGYVLRSGGAAGCDTYFSQGCCLNTPEIYTRDYRFIRPTDQCISQAKDIAARNHPAWDSCQEYIQALHTRNVFQILGVDLKQPSKCVICWTPDGAETVTTRLTGGTGQAIRVAFENNVPVFNLYNSNAVDRLREFVLSGIPEQIDV